MTDRAVRPSLFGPPNGPGRPTGFGFRIPILPDPPRFSDELSTLIGLPTAPRVPGAGGPTARAVAQPSLPPAGPGRIQLAESSVSERPPGVDPGLRRRVSPSDSSAESGGTGLDAAKRIGAAATKAVGRIFEEPLGASRETLGPLVAQSSEERRGVAGLFRAFNEVFVGGGSVAVDGAFRATVAPVVGGIAATVQALQELGMSRTDARRLERDLYAGVTVLGLKSGPALGLQPRLPGPKRVLADANRQGVFDKALATLPADKMEVAKAQLESAFRKGHELGVRARAAAKNRFAKGTEVSSRQVRTVPPASAFSGRKNFELDILPFQPARNKPAIIDGRSYSGHALDQMQNRGITPSLVEKTIAKNISSDGKRPNTRMFHDPENNITVILNPKTDVVVTVHFGM